MINADQRRDDLPRPMGEAPFMSMWSNIGAELKLSEEVAAAAAAGFVPVTFGRRTLRADAVVVCAVSVLQYIWGDL